MRLLQLVVVANRRPGASTNLTGIGDGWHGSAFLSWSSINDGVCISLAQVALREPEAVTNPLVSPYETDDSSQDLAGDGS